MDATGPLFEATKYALLNGGKRLRPVIVLMIAEALAIEKDAEQMIKAVLPAALAIEFFHTASLVADDLPCMDDDDERRNKPSVHKVFGESLALLTSYSLIAAGFSGIATTAKNIMASMLPYASKGAVLGILALENASFNTGLQGATGGQLIDLFPPDLSIVTLRDVIQKKTAALFEVAFLFGWLFGGGDELRINDVKRCAIHFGFAYQIADDLGDVEQDKKNGRTVNLALALGECSAKNMLQDEINGYEELLKLLNINSRALLFLGDELKKL